MAKQLQQLAANPVLNQILNWPEYLRDAWLKSNIRNAQFMTALSLYADMPGTVLVPSSLRVDAVLTNSNTVEFNLSTNTASQPWERRIGLNDNFHLFGYSIALARYNTTTPTNGTTADLHYYPNTAVFPEAAQLEAIYNGSLSANINSVQVMQGLSTQECKYVGTAQQGMAASANATVNLYQESSNTQARIVDLAPALMITGQSTPKIVLNLGSGANMAAAAANNSNVCVFLGYGFLAQTTR